MKMDIYENVKKNKYGFYELKDKYRKEMRNLYRNEYYQSNMGLYQSSYSDEELRYKNNIYNEKYHIFCNLVGEGASNKNTLLDIGCGEGYCLSFFFALGWDVLGIDLSEFGLNTHNPHMKEYFKKGEILDQIQLLCDQNKKFDYINMDNVLEHLSNPEYLLESIKSLFHKGTVLSIRVPNDFSLIQKTAFKYGFINTDFWVTKQTSEHFNYFTEKSLTEFLQQKEFVKKKSIADYPIDCNLFNDQTNYINDKKNGAACHQAQLILANMLYDESMEKAVSVHEALANAGIGRNVTVFCQLN
jgi:methyltransferase type 12